MDWVKKHYDRALVLLFGGLAILGSGWLIAKALGFAGRLATPPVTPRSELSELSTDGVEAAIKKLDASELWNRPKVGEHKTIPMVASTPFVVMNDKPLEPFDMMADDAPELRPPIKNWWLVENDLDYTSIEVRSNDPDRDGYTNLDEWEGKTDPNSSLSRPAFHTKLYFTERLEEPLSLRLSSFDGGTAAIKFVTKDASGAEQSRNEYIKVGGLSRDGRFRVAEVRNETVKRFGSDTVVPVAAVIDIKDPRAKPLRLPQGENVSHPTYIAHFEYTLTNEKFDVKEGLDFELKRPVGTTITLEEIHPDHVIISFVPEGKTEPVREKKELRPVPK